MREPRWVKRRRQAVMEAKKVPLRFVLGPGQVWQTQALDKCFSKVNKGVIN